MVMIHIAVKLSVTFSCCYS